MANGGGGGSNQSATAAKLLVCAPSNAAIDEVCRRLKEGLRSASGKMIFPKVVRMGHEDSMNIAVKDVSLDELIDQKLKDLPSQKKGEGAAEVAGIRQELDALQLSKNEMLEKLRAVADDAAETRLVEEELRRIGSKRSTLAQKLNKAKDQQRDSSRALDAARRKARYEVIAEADVICSTLSGAGHDLLSDCDFETVIIDEAAQAVELSALIPLKYNCKRCIMVGGPSPFPLLVVDLGPLSLKQPFSPQSLAADPNQLPPTVLSRKAEDYRYSESMFVRVQRQAPRNVHLLRSVRVEVALSCPLSPTLTSPIVFISPTQHPVPDASRHQHSPEPRLL
jgi:senataxin